MGAITGGLLVNCAKTCAGGVNRIWITNEDDVDSYTFGANGEITAVTMVVGKVFFEVALKRNTKQFTQTSNTDDSGCNVSWTQTLTGIAQCYDQDIRAFLVELAEQSCCGYVVIHEENSGFLGIWGFVEGLPAQFGPGTSSDTGASITDPNQVTIEIVCNTTTAGLLTEFTAGVGGIPV